jgi:hypothetical protein
VKNKPAKQEEDNDSRDKYPLVLAGTALDHADRVAAHTQCVGNAIQALLRIFQRFALLAQISQDGLSARDKVVQGMVRIAKEVLFSESVGLAHLVASAGRQRSTIRARMSGLE